jgi:hypothetical protein
MRIQEERRKMTQEKGRQIQKEEKRTDLNRE